MSKKIKKFFDVDVKAAEDGSGAYWFTASTPARDRQGDVIVQSGWKTADFMKNPVILWAHNYYETPIGKATEIKMSADSLSVKIQFVPAEIDPFAGKVERLVANGFLKTVSVGFMVYKSEPLTAEDLVQRPDMKYGQRLHGDLLEVSVVPVPANPEALNENAFAEVISRGFGLKQDEAKSKFLPYTDEKGQVNPRLLRASLAAALGARGGVKVTDADHSACVNHLYRVAKDNKIELPDLKALIGKGMDRVELKEVFGDVWHEELLDVLAKVQDEQGETHLKLISGEKRSAIVIARDALNVLLTLSEEEPVAVVPESGTAVNPELLNALGDISKSLSAINDRLH